MSARKYLLLLVGILYAFVMLNAALWNGAVKTAFILGDLNRLGSFITTAPLTENRYYPKHHMEFSDYFASGIRESFDIITIGDSFSNGEGGSFYQDYLVNEYGLRVLNIRLGGLVKYDYVTTLYALNNSGLLDEISPRVVILESVGRAMQRRFGVSELLPVNAGKQEIIRIATNRKKNIPISFLSPVMVKANTKYFITDKLYRLKHPEQLSYAAYITELDRPFFTNPGYERILLYLCEDLDYLTAPLNIGMVNQNLNNAARLLKAKGIPLIFFAAADKYDLYYPYIKDKKGRPENPFFPAFRQVTDREYIFVDTMKILREALERGEQDIYWLGDTHWSHKGIKLVCDELVKYIHGR